MKSVNLYKSAFVAIVSYLYILLFVYAAVSKLLEFEEFRIQLGHSPLISAFAGITSVMVITGELIIAVFLALPNYRRLGLFGAFGLMVLFSAYIFIILNYSPYIPCSCGGILEKMGWQEHLIFNIVFVILAAISVVASAGHSVRYKGSQKMVAAAKLLCVLVLGCALMVLLFFTSNDLIRNRNNFTRTFPPLPRQPEKQVNLGYNSYYFAGASNGKIYLGNYTLTGQVLEWDQNLKNRRVHNISLKNDTLVFRATKIRVFNNSFYLSDGIAPFVYKGNIADWMALEAFAKVPYFTAAEIMDSDKIVVRKLDKSVQGNVLALYSPKDNTLKLHPELLQRQIDGVFDTDGTLQYSNASGLFVYLYYYRNQYIVTDRNLNLISRGNTIDTTTRAKIKIAYQKGKDQKQLSAPPLIVNRRSALHRNLLFVNSTLPGRYDSMRIWDQASIIDIYDLTGNSYLLSFYIYKIDGESLSAFTLTDTHIYALVGNHLVSYKLGESITKAFRSKNKEYNP